MSWQGYLEPRVLVREPLVALLMPLQSSRERMDLSTAMHWQETLMGQYDHVYSEDDRLHLQVAERFLGAFAFPKDAR